MATYLCKYIYHLFIDQIDLGMWWARFGRTTTAVVATASAGYVLATTFEQEEGGFGLVSSSLTYSDPRFGVNSKERQGSEPLPSRESVWKDLVQQERDVRRGKQPVFDVLVIGGGATGTGCALDAQTRYAVYDCLVCRRVFSKKTMCAGV